MKANVLLGLCALLLTPLALGADMDAEKMLIELDKKWGEAGSMGDAAALETLLADDLIDVGPAGVLGKAEALAEAQAGPAEGGPYMADDYQVRFLDDNTAIMVHSATPDPHWSLHVWVKRDGRWQVVASATTPLEE